MKVLFFSICLFFVLEACVRESNSPLGWIPVYLMMRISGYV